MVATVGSIAIDLSTNAAKFTAGFKSAATTVERESARMNKAVAGVASSMRSMDTAVRGFIGGAAARQIIGYADAWTEAGNKIAAAGQIAGVSTRSLEQLTDIADKSRSDLSTTVDLYAKLIRVSQNLNATERQVAEATEIVAKSFKAGGAAASEQAAGILQLSQALGSGVLQGDELRSLRENAPLLAQAIADEFGTTIAGLKELGATGALTSDRVFKAILNSAKEINGAFEKTSATFGDAFTRLENSVIKAIGSIDRGTNSAKRFKDGINELAAEIDRFAANPAFNNPQAFSLKLEQGGVADELLKALDHTDELREQWEAVNREIRVYQARIANTPAGVDTTDAEHALARLQAQADALAARLEEEGITVNLDTTAANAALGEIERRVAGFKASMEAASRPLPTVHSSSGAGSTAADGLEKAIAENTQATNRSTGTFNSLWRGNGLKPLEYSVPAGSGYATGAAASSFKFSGTGSSGSWSGKRLSFSTSNPGMDSYRAMVQAEQQRAMDIYQFGWKAPVNESEDAASTSTAGTTPININVAVKPIIEGDRLSSQSRAEITQAAAAGANAALRAYNGR